MYNFNTKEKPQLSECLHIIFFLCTRTELDYFKWSAKVAQSTCNISFLLMGFSGIFFTVLLLPWLCAYFFIASFFLFLLIATMLSKKTESPNDYYEIISANRKWNHWVSERRLQHNYNEFNRNIKLQMLFGSEHIWTFKIIVSAFSIIEFVVEVIFANIYEMRKFLKIDPKNNFRGLCCIIL